jgi:hypothetical protein
VQSLWKVIWRSFKKLKIELLYDPAIPLLGLYPTENAPGYSKDTCILMFIAALFTIGKYPMVDEWIKKIWCIHNDLLLSHKEE